MMSGKNVLCFKLLGSFQFREGGEAQPPRNQERK